MPSLPIFSDIPPLSHAFKRLMPRSKRGGGEGRKIKAKLSIIRLCVSPPLTSPRLKPAWLIQDYLASSIGLLFPPVGFAKKHIYPIFPPSPPPIFRCGEGEREKEIGGQASLALKLAVSYHPPPLSLSLPKKDRLMPPGFLSFV